MHIDRRRADEPRQGALIDAQQLGLLGRQPAAGPPRERGQLILVGLPELLGRNLGAADLGNGAAPNAPNSIADTPDGEGDDQQAEQGLGNQLSAPRRIASSMVLLVR
jgi:hypothetical protein